MSGGTKWAPVVYGRTLKVDNWWRVIPAGWETSGPMFQALSTFVLSSTRDPYEFRRQPRWVLFQDTDCRVFGIACQARQISQEMTVAGNRDLYTFTGYAARRTPQGAYPVVPQLATLRGREREVFGPVYRRELAWDWERESYQLSSMRHGEFAPVPEIEKLLGAASSGDPSAAGLSPGELNSRVDYVGVWPEREDERLWAAVLKHSGPASACLGFVHYKTALPGSFANVSAKDCPGVKLVLRPRAQEPDESSSGFEPSSQGARAEARAARDRDPRTPPRESDARSPEQAPGPGTDRERKPGIAGDERAGCLTELFKLFFGPRPAYSERAFLHEADRAARSESAGSSREDTTAHDRNSPEIPEREPPRQTQPMRNREDPPDIPSFWTVAEDPTPELRFPDEGLEDRPSTKPRDSGDDRDG